MTKRVCIVGGGISGLCAGYRLQRAGIDVALFEKSSRTGGNIRSERHGEFLIEHGPNSLLATPELVGLISDLGICDRIVQAKPSAKKRFIVRDGTLAALPSGFFDLITSRALSSSAKLRLLKEPFVRTRSPGNESIAAFFERRLGREVVDYAVDPFISGIFAGDPDKLSVEHAFSKIFAFERDHGSVLKGALLSGGQAKRPKGISRTISFKNGVQELVDSLAVKLDPAIRLESVVTSVNTNGSGQFIVGIDDGAEELFDAVIISSPAAAAAQLIEPIDDGLSNELLRIYYPPIAVVYTGYKRENVRTAAEGFGFLVPKREGLNILGSLWTSSVFENRSPAGYHLYTTFIGGSRKADLALKDEGELENIAVDAIDSVLGVNGRPEFIHVKKWRHAIPQYNVGYERVVGAIAKFEAANRGIFFCSNFYRGISVGDCVESSKATTESVIKFLNE